MDLQPETVAELAKLPNIIGIKEATGSMERLAQLQALCPADFLLFSGDDATCCEFMLKGGHGVISVTTNVAPALMSQMSKAALEKNTELAQAAGSEVTRFASSVVNRSQSYSE